MAQFSEMCLYHQTSPDSSFTQKKVCSIATATGRITVTDNKLIVTDRDMRAEFQLKSENEFTEALARYFHIRPE